MKIYMKNSEHVWNVQKCTEAPIASDDHADQLLNGKPYETFQTVDSSFETICPTKFDPYFCDPQFLTSADCYDRGGGLSFSGGRSTVLPLSVDPCA
jgi:hypothetical protein